MNGLVDFLTEIRAINLVLLLGIVYLSYILLSSYLSGRKDYKKLKKQREELEANKCKGFHNWVKMDILGEETNVCQDCNWCPKHDTFVKEYYVKAQLERMEFARMLEVYREERLGEIAQKFIVDPNDIKLIADEIVSIKKDFIIKHIEKKVKQLKKESEDFDVKISKELR